MSKSKEMPRALGKMLDENTVKADLERYRQMALDSGASGAAIISINDVIIDERVRLKCTVPRCLRAGETPNCPPYAPDLETVRRAFSRYHWAIVIKCDVKPMADYAPKKQGTRKEQRKALLFHQKSAEVVSELERRAFRDGYHLAMGLGGGSCKDYLCHGMTCQFLHSGKCRFPHRSRPSMEAFGIDVTSLLNKVGWELYALVGTDETAPCAISAGIVFIY